MNKLVEKILKNIYHIFKSFFRINWYNTFRTNFALLPFKQAIKLPIIVIGKLILDSHKGMIVFECPVKFGLVLIGKDIDNMPIATNSSRLMVDGILIFKGKCIINHSSNVVVWSDGIMTIGKYVIIASGVLLKSAHSVYIGDYTRLASGCFVMDTNAHAIKDTITGYIKRIFNDIKIGDCCWLAMNTSVTAGTKIPNYSISARNSVLNKDYSIAGNIGCFLAGSPAKILKTNVQRIFDIKTEGEAILYFKQNPDMEFYQASPGFEHEEDINVESIFKIY